MCVQYLSMLALLLVYPFVIITHIIDGEFFQLVMFHVAIIALFGSIYYFAPSMRRCRRGCASIRSSFLPMAVLMPVAYLLLTPLGLFTLDSSSWETRGHPPKKSGSCEMIVAAHQPQYLPWLGYLDKLAKADVFVVMDDLQYEAQNFQNRNRVKINSGPAWLTVPLRAGLADRHASSTSASTTAAAAKQHWQHRTWRTLETHYGGRRSSASTHDELRDVFTRRWERLIELDLHMLELARRWFGITTADRARVVARPVGPEDRPHHRHVQEGRREDLPLRSGGSTGYLDQSALQKAGIGVDVAAVPPPDVPAAVRQVGFVSHLAFIDLLFNCGPESRRDPLGPR